MVNTASTEPFRQFAAANVISASTTSARATLARAAEQNVVVSNPSANVCFVNFGTSANTATSADIAVLSGQSRVFSIPATVTHVAVLLDTGTGTIYVSCGDGI